MSEIALSVKGLNFGYNETPILKDVTFEVKSGDYVSIIGPNGAGKSTLIKCLNRILLVNTGSISVFGRQLPSYTQKDLGRVVGYVPQVKEEVFSYTVYEFVKMGRYPYRSPFTGSSSKDHLIIEEALELTGLKELEHRRMNQLSGGQRQKVYLAAALAQQPRILLLDEPTTHLDPQNHVDIQHMIAAVSRKLNITILHVTHDLNHIFYWSKHIIALKDGKVCHTGQPDKVMTTENLQNLFEAGFLKIPHPTAGHDIIVPEVHR